MTYIIILNEVHGIVYRLIDAILIENFLIIPSYYKIEILFILTYIDMQQRVN